MTRGTPITRTAHLVIGPDQHGVVQHASTIAAACGQQLIRQPAWSPDDLELSPFDVVHVPFTDRLFGTSAEASAVAFSNLADAVEAAGCTLSVTLHDLPVGDDPRQVRRARCYAAVVARCRGVVLNSWHELELAQGWGAELRSLRVIRLPIDPVHGVRPAPSGAEVGVLGFLYPDRGYDKVLAELPEDCGLVAIGRPSQGHDELPAVYAAEAERLGRRWHCTGYLEPTELRARLLGVAVPIAPNQRVSASASINAWLAHGRRPLVARSAYAEELEREHPGLMVLYDPDCPGQLRSLIADRLANPAATVLERDCLPGSNLAQLAADYREHLLACRAPAPVEVAGRYLLPDNRWDLLPPLDNRSIPEVSVVVPYFRAQQQLDLVLAGLSLQTHPRSRLQVIVADDGSPRPPRVHDAGLPVQVVRQEDRGFRAAAARNLGASVADGQVLLFLDGDTVPEPDYVERLTRLPAVAHDLLVTGRRRHANLASMTVEQVRSWLTGRSAAPPELPAPGWLEDGHRRTRNLLAAGPDAYRLVISAVLGIDRQLFDELAGFDAGIEGYGGEDWELAYRAYQAGGVFAHVPEAVAWHDGPDWAGRPVRERRAVKNAETLMLAQRIPDPGLRDGGGWFARPAVVITMPGADDVSVLATARSAFSAQPDCGFWLLGDGASDTARRLADPRIRWQPPPQEVLRSCRVRVELTRPADLSGLAALIPLTERLGQVVTPVGTLSSNRSLARVRRWQDALPEGGSLLFGRQDRAGLRPWPAELELDRVLADLRRADQVSRS